MAGGAITLSIDSTLDDVALVGRAVRAICRALPGGARAASDVELCVVEAVNNAIEHSYGGLRGQRVDVHFIACDGWVEIEVVDHGRGFGDSGPPCLVAPDVLDEGGRGLYIMHALMDEVTFRRENSCNVVRLTRRLGRRRLPS